MMLKLRILATGTCQCGGNFSHTEHASLRHVRMAFAWYTMVAHLGNGTIPVYGAWTTFHQLKFDRLRRMADSAEQG